MAVTDDIQEQTQTSSGKPEQGFVDIVVGNRIPTYVSGVDVSIYDIGVDGQKRISGWEIRDKSDIVVYGKNLSLFNSATFEIEGNDEYVLNFKRASSPDDSISFSLKDYNKAFKEGTRAYLRLYLDKDHIRPGGKITKQFFYTIEDTEEEKAKKKKAKQLQEEAERVAAKGGSNAFETLTSTGVKVAEAFGEGLAAGGEKNTKSDAAKNSLISDDDDINDEEVAEKGDVQTTAVGSTLEASSVGSQTVASGGTVETNTRVSQNLGQSATISSTGSANVQTAAQVSGSTQTSTQTISQGGTVKVQQSGSVTQTTQPSGSEKVSAKVETSGQTKVEGQINTQETAATQVKTSGQVSSSGQTQVEGQVQTNVQGMAQASSGSTTGAVSKTAQQNVGGTISQGGTAGLGLNVSGSGAGQTTANSNLNVKEKVNGQAGGNGQQKIDATKNLKETGAPTSSGNKTDVKNEPKIETEKVQGTIDPNTTAGGKKEGEKEKSSGKETLKAEDAQKLEKPVTPEAKTLPEREENKKDVGKQEDPSKDKEFAPVLAKLKENDQLAQAAAGKGPKEGGLARELKGQKPERLAKDISGRKEAGGGGSGALPVASKVPKTPVSKEPKALDAAAPTAPKSAPEEEKEQQPVAQDGQEKEEQPNEEQAQTDLAELQQAEAADLARQEALRVAKQKKDSESQSAAKQLESLAVRSRWTISFIAGWVGVLTIVPYYAAWIKMVREWMAGTKLGSGLGLRSWQKAVTVVHPFIPPGIALFIVFGFFLITCNYTPTWAILYAVGLNPVCEALDTTGVGSYVRDNLGGGGTYNQLYSGPLSSGQWASFVNPIAEAKDIDACILQVVIKKEAGAGGDPHAIGCDCLGSSRSSCSLSAGPKFGFNANNPPEYNLNWNTCSYGIGLTQWTIYQRNSTEEYKKWNGEIPSRNVFGTWYTAADFLNPQISLELTAEKFKRELQKNRGNLYEAFRSYNGSGAMAERYAQDAMRIYQNECRVVN